MSPEDLADLFRIHCEAHAASYHEPFEVLVNRLEAAPVYCFVAGRGESFLAYLLSHP